MAVRASSRPPRRRRRWWWWSCAWWAGTATGLVGRAVVVVVPRRASVVAPRLRAKTEEEEERGTRRFLRGLLETAQERYGAPQRRRVAARTISGLVEALAEESSELEVDVETDRRTPLWRKKVRVIRVRFRRLGFKPVRMGGMDSAVDGHHRGAEGLATSSEVSSSSSSSSVSASPGIPLSPFSPYASLASSAAPATTDEAFSRIDADNSGALDAEELADALRGAAPAGGPSSLFDGLADRLVSLYDTNDDGALDRDEYQTLVEDMAALRRGAVPRPRPFWTRWFPPRDPTNTTNSTSVIATTPHEEEEEKADLLSGVGSITFSDVTMDLRRLLFGVLPLVKKIAPGGPLVLEPFTVTVRGSFTADDVADSVLLDTGLRLLVARVLRRRVRSWRDLADGAVFYGRTWTAASSAAPRVEVPRLESIEFDDRDRAVVGGRFLLQTSPDAPTVENAFKLRFRLGTRAGGRVIRLRDPELALVLECPRAWERNIESACRKFKLPVPDRPKPLYSFIPLVSFIKKNDKDGYDMGEDNRIRSIEIKDGALRVEMSAVLRPGRFLGNHYVAFTVPNRSVICTLDRVREGIRVARRNKRNQRLASSNTTTTTAAKVDEDGDDKDDHDPGSDQQGFFNKFLRGYMKASKEDRRRRGARLASAVSEWFGRPELGNYLDDVDDDERRDR